MEEPNIKEITKTLEKYSQNLEDNAQRGNSKIVLAFTELIKVMAWSSKKQEEYSTKLVNLTWGIIGLTVILIIGLAFQIFIALK